MELDRRIRKRMLIGTAALGINAVLILGGISHDDTKAEAPVNSSYTMYVPRIEVPFPSEEKKETITLQQRLGFHGIPFPDDLPNNNSLAGRTVEFVKAMGGTSLVVINPGEKTLEKANNNGVAVIARYYSSENRFSEEKIGSLVNLMQKYQETFPIIVPFNEVNLSYETENTYRSPEEHIEQDFLPAFKLISNKGGITLLTPLAQNAVAIEDSREVDEFEYFERMLVALRRHLTDDELQSVGLGLHAYAMHPGDDIRPRLYKINDIAKEVLGIKLPMFLTETGLFQGKNTSHSPELVAEETERIFNEPIELDNIVNANVWVVGNGGFRPYDPKNPQAMEEYDKASVVNSQGEFTKTGLMFKRVAEEQNQRRILRQIFP